MPLACKLSDSCPCALGNALAFTCGLPVTDIVCELVYMIVKALLSLAHAPDLYAVFHQPLYNKRRLVVSPSDSIKHEYQQHIKLFQ